MGNKMLIDAAHPEETRVVVLHGNRVEEFDFESENKKQLRGNIYLAKVTRVEPSLQAAFVDYGGNRHGFLAFSEIHPDYYQIPVADREELLKEQAEEARAAEDDDDNGAGAADAEASANTANGETIDAEAAPADDAEEVAEEAPESVGSEDALEEVAPRKKRRSFRSYKIQEVIKRRQILLVQVVKEERGNKGAALTTYLSLAGRYCVLMPNTARGGGISRKITNAPDRKRLKTVAGSLEVPEGMGLIVRTAGAKRTKAEIKRDYEYLLRLWETVRALTLKSSAPTLVYEEGSLIKRSIRDLYNKDIDAVVVEGDEGYREAKAFMKMLMPSHAKNVQPYKEQQPLFQKHQIEQQLDSMFNPTVQLKSGGYIVINPTEALVSIDVNSGRATRERNIEATALKTNLEAAAEVARQMRLRDLAGLIVIDFIDMEENRNNRSVERKLKDCLKTDRARIQIGRISNFGLLEMSRQRMRAGLLEGSTNTCPVCAGTGLIRSVESTVLHVLREIEAEALKGKSDALTLRVPTDVALYILNQKRASLLDIEARCNVSVFVEADPELQPSDWEIEQVSARETGRARPAEGAVNVESGYDEAEEEERETEAAETAEAPKRKRRPRRRKKKQDEAVEAETEAAESEAVEDVAAGGAEAGDTEEEAKPKSKRRRGRRGGRRNRRRPETAEAETAPDEETGDVAALGEVSSAAPESGGEEPVLLAYSRDAADEPEGDTEIIVSAGAEAPVEPQDETAPGEPAADNGAGTPADVAIRATAEDEAVAEDEQPEAAEAAETTAEPQPRRRGWWQRRSV